MGFPTHFQEFLFCFPIHLSGDSTIFLWDSTIFLWVACIFLGWGSHFCFQIFGYIFYLGDGELELRYYYFCKKKDMIQKDLYGGYIVPTEAITYNKPDEVVTDAEKERDGGEWYLSNSRYIVNRFYNQVINGGVEGDRTGVSDMIREMFLYYYGEHSQDVYNYEIGMGGVGIGTPFVADQRPRTLLEHARGRLYQMIEPVKRSMAVRSLDYEVQMKRKGLKEQLEAKRVIDPLIRGTGVEFMPEGISDIGDNEDIDSIVKKYRTETEIGALNLARGIYYEEECERKFDYLALHQIVGNISFLAFDISGGRIGIRPIPCSQVIFDDRQIGDYSDDCEVGGYIVYMTPSEVFQRWGSVYEDKEKREFLEDMARGKTMSGFNMEGVMKYYNTGDNITYWDRQTGKVAVAVTYWLSYSTQDYYVTSGGTVRRLRKGSQYLDGDKVVKGYEKEGVDRKLKWHYCITVGNAVVADYGYVPYQYTPQGKGRPLPPFAYYINNFHNGMLKPMSARIKPISDQIEAAGRKLKELMDRSAGKTYLLYGAKLGLTKDQAPDIFSDLRSIGFSVIEGSGQPGNDVDERRAITDVLDFSLQPEVQEFIRWRVLLQQEQDAIMNMPPAVLGTQDKIIGKGVQENTIVQSQLSFMSLMTGYQRFIMKVMRQAINIGKMINADYGGRQFYQVSDSEVEDIKFPKSAKYEDMGFFFEADDIIEDSDKQALRTMLQAYMQNPTSSGAKAIRNTMQLMSFKSYAEGIKMLDNFIIEEEKKEGYIAQQQQQMQQQMQAQIQQMQQQFMFFMEQYKQDQENYRKELEVLQKQSDSETKNFNKGVEMAIKQQDMENKMREQQMMGGGEQEQQEQQQQGQQEGMEQ